jgi:hypothetical protein
MSDDRSPRQQLSDLGGLFTGRNKIEGGRIVPKNPPASSDDDRDDDVDVDVNVNR